MKNFSSNYFKEAFRQTKGLGLAYTCTALLFACFVPFIELLQSLGDKSVSADLRSVADFAGSTAYICSIFAFFFVLKLFSFLFKRGASDFYHALPFTRQCIYITNIAVCLVWYVLGLLVSLTAETVIYSLNPNVIIKPRFALYVFTTTIISMLMVTGATLIAVSISGKASAVFTSAAIILLLPRIIYTLGITAVEEKTMVIIDEAVKYFSPKFNIVYALTFGVVTEYGSRSQIYTYIPGKIISLLIAFLYMSAGLYLFYNRKSERAEDSVKSERVNCFKQVSFTLPFFITAVCGMFIDEGSDEEYIIVLGIGIAVFLGYGIFAERKLKKFLKSLLRFIYVAAGSLIFFIIISTVCDSLLSKELKGDDILSVKEYFGGYNYNYYYAEDLTYYEIMVRNIEYTDKEILNLVAKGYDSAASCAKEKYSSANDRYINSRYGDIIFEITYKDKSKNVRRIMLEEKDYNELTELMSRNPDKAEAMISIPDDCYIFEFKKQENNEKFWKCLKDEFERIPESSRKMTTQGTDEEGAVINYAGYYGDTRYSGNLYLYPDLMPETCELYEELSREENLEIFRWMKKAVNGDAPESGNLNFRTNYIRAGSREYSYIEFMVTFAEGEIADAEINWEYFGKENTSPDNAFFESVTLDKEEAKEFVNFFDFEKRTTLDTENAVNVSATYFAPSGFSSEQMDGHIRAAFDLEKLDEFLRRYE